MNTTARNKKEIMPKDIVDVIPCGLRALPLKASVVATARPTPDSEITRIELGFEDPPVWYQTMERKRGVFMHPSATRTMSLYKNQAGTWTDLQTLKQYTIQKRN